MPEPVIYIQCGDGVLYPFAVDELRTFGVLPLNKDTSAAAVTLSYLLNDGEGHTHAVVTGNRSGKEVIPLNSGTELECHHWLASIAVALTQAGLPAVMTKPVTFGEGPLQALDSEDSRRWGKS